MLPPAIRLRAPEGVRRRVLAAGAEGRRRRRACLEEVGGERDRVGGVTGLPGIVAPRDDGGTTVYRVILGKFASRGAAERKAQALMDSSLVREANVVARPKSGS